MLQTALRLSRSSSLAATGSTGFQGTFEFQFEGQKVQHITWSCGAELTCGLHLVVLRAAAPDLHTIQAMGSVHMSSKRVIVNWGLANLQEISFSAHTSFVAQRVKHARRRGTSPVTWWACSINPGPIRRAKIVMQVGPRLPQATEGVGPYVGRRREDSKAYLKQGKALEELLLSRCFHKTRTDSPVQRSQRGFSRRAN